MSFFGFGKKKEEKVTEPLPPPEPSPSASQPEVAQQGIPPPVDAAALLGSKSSSDLKQEDFPYEHIGPLPIEIGQPGSQPAEKVEVVPQPEMPAPDQILDDAPSPEEHKDLDLSELSKQLPIQDVPRPQEEAQQEESMELSLDFPDDLRTPEPEPKQEESLPGFTTQQFEEVAQPQEEEPLPSMEEHGRYDAPAELASDLMGADRKVRRFKVTKINGELFVEAESYKFFLENMVTMHDDLMRTNELFMKYSNENIEEDKLYKRMFQQLNAIHEDLIKVDHELFEREETR